MCCFVLRLQEEASLKSGSKNLRNLDIVFSGFSPLTNGSAEVLWEVQSLHRSAVPCLRCQKLGS